MELDSRRKSKRDKMMRSNSFEMQEVGVIGRTEAGKSRGFSILWIRIIEDVSQMEGKEIQNQERLKVCKKTILTRGGKRLKKEGQLVELVGDQKSIPEVPRKKITGRESREQRRCRRGVTAREVIVRKGHVKDVREDDPIEYFLLTGFRSTF